jgi:hypothetical protein
LAITRALLLADAWCAPMVAVWLADILLDAPLCGRRTWLAPATPGRGADCRLP